MSFKDLKKASSSQFEKLAEAAENLTKNKYKEDERFWKPTVDASGNAQAIIRFLPPTDGEDVPFVRYYDHFFQGPGGYYVENSLTSIGKEDPLGQMNQRLWNSGIEANKKIASARKRRQKFVSNIYVVSDKGNPDAEGKVFLFRYGKKIFDMLNGMMHPEFEGDEPVNPFDFWKGANFRLRQVKVSDFPNYDKSTFDSPSALKDDDAELEAIYNQMYPLNEFIDPDGPHYKTYEELQEKLTRVLGEGVTTTAETAELEEEEELPWSPPEEKASESEAVSSAFDDDDEDLKAFQDLVDD